MPTYTIEITFPGVDEDRKIELERLKVDYLQKGNGDWCTILYNLKVTDGAKLGLIRVYTKEGRYVTTFKLVEEKE